ncbi:ROK family transcriptional regulator [Phyllobacterium myrsinacearum]|uniref:Transcriptional regulator of PTS protein n=1 Tax=Phyllobacterium myrsinacearum TaxID=28101 RepID=A0A839EPD5_9HYPH|nr:ROK family transcriptional regulator [Phyllobacterium myrsinacearum]MBA8879354.1 transcriptional regulator of PTS gene [Phyllobacterium myrsinacearum]
MILTVDETHYDDAHQRDCARVIALISNGRQYSRPSIAEALDMTSTTTSKVVGDLIARGLLVETAGEKSGRGRPAIRIGLNARRLGATVIHVSSRSLRGTLVDFGGRALERAGVDIPDDVDRDQMTAAMRDLIRSLVGKCPPGMQHIGTSVSVSGVVDVKSRTWLLTSRWPNIRDFDLATALAPVTPEVLVCRHLDAELNARLLQDPVFGTDNTLLLHWGWGIGLAYSVNGDSFIRAGGPFGEIGHWRFNLLEDRACGCGNYGCLETAASLWALLPRMREIWPDLSEDEELLAGQMSGLPLLDMPDMRTGLQLMARSLANVCRLLFPKRVIVTGPFIANADIWQTFEKAFQAEGLIGTLELPALLADRSSEDFAILGAVRPLFNLGLETFIRS